MVNPLGAAQERGEDLRDRAFAAPGRPDEREATEDEDKPGEPGVWMIQQDAPHEVAEDPGGLQRPVDRDDETGDVIVRCDDGRSVRSTHAVLAIGSVPNTDGIGLDAAGVEVHPWGHIPIDDHCRTNLHWSNPQVLMRFVLIQALAMPILFLILVKIR